jgi:hypothetical protein
MSATGHNRFHVTAERTSEASVWPYRADMTRRVVLCTQYVVKYSSFAAPARSVLARSPVRRARRTALLRPPGRRCRGSAPGREGRGLPARRESVPSRRARRRPVRANLHTAIRANVCHVSANPPKTVTVSAARSRMYGQGTGPGSAKAAGTVVRAIADGRRETVRRSLRSFCAAGPFRPQ